MRTAAFGAIILLALSACSTTNSPAATDSPYVQPNQLMSAEITRRIEQIQFLHREELVDNLLWLVQAGEQSIPATLIGLKSGEPKTRSSCAWVLGMLKDRRTIPNLQAAMSDSEPAVRYECGRSLVLLGDLTPAPVLIEGLDSERKEVRFMCHEALKQATGHDFGYDHLAVSQDQMRNSVLRWRQWWGEYSGDVRFAQSYQTRYGLNGAQAAAPGGETMPQAQGNESTNSGASPNQNGAANPNSGASQSSQNPSGAPNTNTNPGGAPNTNTNPGGTPNTNTNTNGTPNSNSNTNGSSNASGMPSTGSPTGVGTSGAAAGSTKSGYSSGVPTNPSNGGDMEIQVVPVSNPTPAGKPNTTPGTTPNAKPTGAGAGSSSTTGGAGSRSNSPNGIAPNGNGGN